MIPKNLPFDFVIDYLYPLQPVVKPMFGFFGVYIDDKIMLVLRQRTKNPEINGVWVATTRAHHESLKKDLPSLQPVDISMGAIKDTEWQMLAEGITGFEEEVIKVCELIKRRDMRIGRIPIPKKKKS